MTYRIFLSPTFFEWLYKMLDNSGNLIIPQNQYHTIKASPILKTRNLKLNTKIMDTLKLRGLLTAGWGQLALFPLAIVSISAFTSITSCCYRTLTLVLLWISFSTAATQTVNKIHCIFAPLSSSVFWHIQMPGLKRVNNENNIFLSRHSKKDLTKASEEDAAGRDTMQTAGAFCRSNSLTNHVGSLVYKYSEN